MQETQEVQVREAEEELPCFRIQEGEGQQLLLSDYDETIRIGRACDESQLGNGGSPAEMQ
jgi:hypothetical protein